MEYGRDSKKRVYLLPRVMEKANDVYYLRGMNPMMFSNKFYQTWTF